MEMSRPIMVDGVEDVESGFADAYEGDVTARWNND